MIVVWLLKPRNFQLIKYYVTTRYSLGIRIRCTYKKKITIGIMLALYRWYITSKTNIIRNIYNTTKKEENTVFKLHLFYKILNKLIFCSLVAIGTCMQLLTSTIF